MRWIKCKENVPDKNGLYLITHLNGGRWQMFFKTEDKKWYWQPNPYSVCGDGFIDQWLDESIPTSIEQESERLYPINSQLEKTQLPIYKIQQLAHITAARMYMGEMERLKDLIKNLYDTEVREPCKNAGASDDLIESHWQDYKLKNNL